MIFSMTAFARSERTTAWGSLAWELRSVNHRYLEVALRLPEELRGLEPKVREAVADRVARGRVDVSLYWKPNEANAQAIDLDTAQLGRVTAALTSLSKFGIATAPANAIDLLRWPGVMRTQTLDVEGLSRDALSQLAQALDELRGTRAREGARLKSFMLERLTAVEGHVQTVQAVLPEVVSAFRERLNARLAEISASLDRARLEQEIVLFANRTDVAEELERLAAHVQETRRALEGGGQIGRRLDFLMQEFNREANTLGSKSADLRVTNVAVELKVLIEQMREQVQNIE
ncbi:MAG TPA: YicC/YloC family endoribonuclease [Burkholderiales bacterium]|nr:YicC/YloC family endoribonuclease [Burkholderiales bacterium]